MKLAIIKNRVFRPDILLILVLFLLTIPAEYSEIFQLAEEQTVSLRHMIRNTVGGGNHRGFPIDQIVIIKFDDVFFKEYNQYYLRRSDIARIIDNLNSLGAGVIAINFLFQYPGSPQEDAVLARSIKTAGTVVLSSQALFDENHEFKTIEYPIPLLKAISPSGYVNVMSSSHMVTCLSRVKIHPRIAHLKDGWPISVQIASKFMDVSPGISDNRLVLGKNHIVLNQFNEFLVDFSSIPNFCTHLHEYAGMPAHEFLDFSSKDEDEIRELKQWVKDKIVIIGDTAKISNDWFDTPAGMLFGAEFIAESVQTLINGGPLKAAPIWLEIFSALICLTALLACSMLIAHPGYQSLSMVTVLMVYCAFCTWLYVFNGIVVSMVYTLLAGAMGFLALAVCSYFRERISRLKVSGELIENRASLKHAEANYRGIFENALEGIFQVYPNGRLIRANPALVELLGYESFDELKNGMRDSENPCFFTPEDQKKITENLEQKGEIKGYKAQILRRDGRQIWISVSARAVTGHNDGSKYYDGCVLDITEEKRKERAEQERQIAEESNRAKSEFIAGMSHEIRTPLNAIIGMTHLMFETDMTQKQRIYQENIHSSSQTLLGLINDILDFSKIEAGKLELKNESFYLKNLLNELGNMFRYSADEKQISLSLSASENVPEVIVCDGFRLKQVLINLIGNAIKFTEKGKIEVDVHGSLHSGKNAHLVFNVKDTGIGIPPDKLKTLFDPFTQADGSTTRKYGGSGLGLSICKRIVTSMGGDIRVESDPGKGSLFSFTIEAEYGTEGVKREDHAAAASPVRIDRQILEKLKGAEILVVEDNPINQDVTGGMLENAQMSAEIVSNGMAAIEAVRKKTFDAVLMDIQMPEMDGYEAALKIRQFNTDIPIIAMTAHAMRECMERCLQVGMNDYVFKPINTGHFFSVLAKWVTPKKELPPSRIRHNRDLKIPDKAEVTSGLPNKLPGIDIKAALQRMSGKEAFYKRLLFKFAGHYPRHSLAVKTALENQEIENACRLLHNIKGAAANLSANTLSDAAKSLESALKNGGDKNIEQLFNAFEASLRQVMDSIHSLEGSDQ